MVEVIRWTGNNGIISDSTFSYNFAGSNGGGVDWVSTNGIILGSTFNDNTATLRGGAISCSYTITLTNCGFNSVSVNSNGIYGFAGLNINGGSGIVYIFVNSTLSGTSIVVLNNETYYYPPNSNINFKDYFFLFGYNFFVNFVIIWFKPNKTDISRKSRLHKSNTTNDSRYTNNRHRKKKKDIWRRYK